jgi:hypothetical protein
MVCGRPCRRGRDGGSTAVNPDLVAGYDPGDPRERLVKYRLILTAIARSANHNRTLGATLIFLKIKKYDDLWSAIQPFSSDGVYVNSLGREADEGAACQSCLWSHNVRSTG